ncbi:Halomucin [Bienertia sinuspersici]
MVRTRGGATKKADDDTNDKVGKEDARKELSEDERGCVQNDEEDDDLNEEDGGDDDGEDGEEGGEINEEESEQEEEEEEQFGEEESGEDSDGQEKSSEGDVEDFDEEKESGEGDVEDSDEEKESSEGDVEDANEEPSDDSPIYKRVRKNARTEKVKKSNAPAKKMKVNKKDAPLEKKKNNEKCQRIENAPVEKVKKIRRSIEKVKKIRRPIEKVNFVYVSAFMRSNRAIMKSLPRLHQEIADFCLVDDDESPLLGVDLVWYDLNHSIPGDELLSLQGVFSKDDNDKEVDTLFSCWTDWVDNVNNNFDLSEVKLADMLSTFLDIRCHPNASNILEFQMEVVNFDWKSSTETNDCGVYAMIHMLLFEGSSFTCEDLKRVKKRALMRAQICATLVLMDANSARSDVLTRLQEFNPQRGAIQKEVARRKKIKDQERKKQEEEENADKRKKECEAKKTSKQEKENADAKKRKKSSKDQADKQEKNSRKMAKKN